jgi:[protein-PII] uridylyltransferase
MTPGSDVDLLFLHVPDVEVAAVADRVLYPLWDSGVRVGHSVKTLDECLDEAAGRVETLTALLSARLLIGSVGLLDSLRHATHEAVRVHGLVDQLEKAREARKGRFGHLAHQLEPDLKESLGGLRDHQLLSWLTSIGRGSVLNDPKRFNEWASALPRHASTAADVLLRARTALHRVAGPTGTRLASDHHEMVADALGLVSEPGWEPRDALMREVFKAGRWIDAVATHALRVAADRWIDPSPSTAQIRSLFETELASLLEEGLTVTQETSDPIRLREALLPLPEFPWTQGLRSALVRAVSPWKEHEELELWDAVGLMVRLIPEWSMVSGRPQRDPYHRFPVDVHLMATVAEAARLIRHPDEPFVAEAVTSMGDPEALLLGALLHDIGKTGSGGHVPEGTRIAAKVLDRMGVSGDRREDVLFLVGEHLLLSDTATRRNIEDEDLILQVAARVGDEPPLALLYLLSVADATATGPSASTPWRMTLVRDLVAKVSHVFARGSMDRVQAGRLAEIEAGLRLQLADLPAGDVDAFLAAVPTSYLQSVDPSHVSEHLPLVLPQPGEDEIRTRVRPGRSPGTNLVAVAARDRLGLLASIAGAMTLSGLSILSAQVFTTEHGVALDLFEVRGAFESEIPAERWRRFERALGAGLRGALHLGTEVARLRTHYRPPARGVPVSVDLHQDASDFFTVAEVEGPDRLGLLFDLTSALAQHGFDVHSAKVATYGPRVVDVFYVAEADGQKVGARTAELEEALRGAASAG